ncbi:uncharacterized protein VTP21DRAFT_4475 [Calcarisporiella thermophila]|uniref:uncharacterized protein n=1 Tax=Calcarisporiella thermophila TaxID=911321 RepID=UPI0037426133
MKKLFCISIFFCILTLTCSDVAPQIVPLRTHTLAMPYIDQGLQNYWFDFGGDAVISTSKHIRLTHDRPSQVGWLWSRLPLASANWDLEIEFSVDGKGSIYGDGFAIFLTRQRAQTGPVFGFIDKFEGLGIFFDTYKNSRSRPEVFPYVMIMQGDGNTPYDSENDGKANELAGCEADFRSKPFPTKARLVFYKGYYLALTLQYRSENEWDTCFLLENITLPFSPYLGISAHTGDLSDNHDIIRVTAQTIVSVPDSTYPAKPIIKKKHNAWSAFLWYVKFMGFLVFVIGGIWLYRTRIMETNRRF